MTFDPKEARALVEHYTTFARRDDCLERMVPSDLRMIVGRLTAALDEIERLREYAFEVSKALTGLTVGGSEFFNGKERFGFFEADIPACVKNINWRMEQREELAAAKARTALKGADQ